MKLMNRTLYTDILRIIACFSVIVIHTTAAIVSNMKTFNSSTWWVGNFYFSITRWSVPIFIMLSGMYLLEKEESYFNLFKKRILKLIIPLFAWGWLYKLWDIKIFGGTFLFSKANLEIINGNAYYHLWYLYTLIGLYIAIPVLAMYVKGADEKNILYFFVVWVFSNVMISLLNKFLHLNVGFKVPIMVDYVGYFILGYYLSKKSLKNKTKRIIYFMAIISVIINMLGSYYINIGRKVLDQFFYGYLSLTTVIISFAIFILFKDMNFNALSNSVKCIIFKISPCCFGIYLAHVMIINSIMRITYLKNQYMNYVPKSIGIPLLTLIVFFISLALVLALRKIPIIKSIV